MTRWERTAGALAGAWELLLDLPLPERLLELGGRVRHEDKLAAAPWLGLFFGFLLYLLAKIIGGAFHPVAGAVLFGIALAAFLEFKEAGRSPLFAANFLGTWIRSGRREVAMQTVETADQDEVSPLASGLIPLFFMLKAAAGYLFFRYHAPAWGIMVIAGSFTLQCALAVAVEPPVFRVKDEYRNRLWISFAVVSFLVFLAHPVGTIVAVLCVVFGSRWLIARWRPALGAAGITLAGTLTEWVLLAAGLLFTLS